MAIVLTKNVAGPVREDFYSIVKERASRERLEGNYDFVYIVPTRRRVREVERDLAGTVSFSKLPVYTLELFAQRLFALLNSGRRMVPVSMQGMIINRIISRMDLKFFRYAMLHPGSGRASAPFGTIKKIVDEIGFLKENGISPDDYRLFASSAEKPEKLKLEEFSGIYDAYENELGETLLDSSGLVTFVNSRLSSSPEVIENVLPAGTSLFVEGFYNFKKPEVEFLRILSRRKEISFSIKLDCKYENDDLFRTMAATAADLSSRGFETAGAQTAGPHQIRMSPGAGEFFGSYLFSDNVPQEKIDLRGRAFIVSVRDNLREAEFVAEKIREIVRRDPSQALDGICVASYLPQKYSRLFREVFSKYRIPANITDRYTLESSSVVNAILSFMDVRLNSFERGSLLRAVTNKLADADERLDASQAGSIIFNAAALCRFERGIRTFRSSIAAKIALLERLGPEQEFDTASRDVSTLKKAARILDSIEEKLSGFSERMAPAGFRKAVRILVARLNIPRNILRGTSGVSDEVLERDARALGAFFDVLDEVTESKEDTPQELGLWIEDLRAALSLTRYNIRQKYGYGVYVTALEEMRGLEFDHVFIVGLNEGDLPTRYTPEIFLPMSLQKDNRETQPYLQRHLFYQAVSSFKKSLHLLHPVQRDEVRLPRSSFVDALTLIAETDFIDDVSVPDSSRGVYNIHQLIEANVSGTDPGDKLSALLPSNLDRCKSAEGARVRDDTESEFNGKITDGNLAGTLEKFFADRVFSAAQIESLSRCGFQYFARRVLQIAEAPEIETALSAIERGSVLHKILFRFYTTLSQNGRAAAAKDELDLLVETGKEVLDELGIDNELFEVERDAILGKKNIPGTLELFLRNVQSKLSEYGFTPEYFELGFDSPVMVGDIAVRGKIDRIDSKGNELAILDYKSSRYIPVHKHVVGKKISPQLLIYLNALNSTASPVKGAVPTSAAFVSINREVLLRDQNKSITFIVQEADGKLRYNTTYGGTHATPGAANYPGTMSELLAGTAAFVSRKVEEARSGRFNLTRFPYKDVCTFCPYSEACRIRISRSESTDEEEGSV